MSSTSSWWSEVHTTTPTSVTFSTVRVKGIPPGFAHGFQALDDSTVLYFVTHNLRLILIFLLSGIQSLKLYGTF
jgi:hypothetical protein